MKSVLNIVVVLMLFPAVAISAPKKSNGNRSIFDNFEAASATSIPKPLPSPSPSPNAKGPPAFIAGLGKRKPRGQEVIETLLEIFSVTTSTSTATSTTR